LFRGVRPVSQSLAPAPLNLGFSYKPRWSTTVFEYFIGKALLPVLALLGLWQGTRELFAQWQLHPEWLQMAVRDGHVRDSNVNGPSWNLEVQLYWIYVSLLALDLAAWGLRWLIERRRGLIRITYPGGKVVHVPVGHAVLDASRRANIPHAAICGGRGRCTSCRIRVLPGGRHVATT
jgi:adenylate cyclase